MVIVALMDRELPPPASTPGVADGLFPVNGPVDVHPALEEVLRMKEFQPPEPGLWDKLWAELMKVPVIRELNASLETLFNAFTHGLQNLLNSLRLPDMSRIPENIAEIFTILLGLLLSLLALYVLYIVSGWLLQLRREKSAPAGTMAAIVEETLLVSADYHYGEAASFAHSGNETAAVRQLYLAILCLLNDSGAAPFEAARTNREYLNQLRQHPVPELAADFEKLASRFESVRYGKQTIDARQFRTCDEAYLRMRSTLLRPVAA